MRALPAIDPHFFVAFRALPLVDIPRPSLVADTYSYTIRQLWTRFIRSVIYLQV